MAAIQWMLLMVNLRMSLAAALAALLPSAAILAMATSLPAVSFLPSPALASPELARSKNCVACHHVERKMIGPSYKAVAERYAKDEAALPKLSEKVIKGGAGNWGPTPMPAQANVTPTEAEALIKWILSQQ
jgi:cytochrome c